MVDKSGVDEKLRELALFAGAGGGILGGRLLGWRTVCAVELDRYAASVLLARQNEGFLPHFPVWDDVRTFDGRPWRGVVDVVSGGFPCQDISVAGKGAGIEGERSGLWKEMARIIGEVRPRYVLVENSPMLVSRGLGYVLSDLATMGFDAQWGVLGAVDVGAPHKRDRIWIVAHADSTRELQSERGKQEQRGRVSDRCKKMEYSDDTGCKKQRVEIAGQQEHSAAQLPSWWEAEPGVGRVVDGLADRVDRLKALGNGQVPAVAAIAFRILSSRNH